MEEVFQYLLKVNLVMAVMVGVFYLFFRREKFLHLNRFLLLSVAVLSFTIPFFPAVSYEIISSEISDPIADLLVAGNNFITPSTIKISSGSQRVSFFDFAGCIYLFVSVIFLLRLFVQVCRTLSIIYKSEKRKEDGLIYCTSGSQKPFSFFHYIVISETPEEFIQQQVLFHESAHAKHWHSVDALLSELISAVCWINPFVYLYKKLVRINLEFLADDSVLATGTDRKMYQLGLLRYVMKPSAVIVVNSFYSSNIKTRIGMMNTESPSRVKGFRYMLIVPVLFIIYFIINPPQPVYGMATPVKQKIKASVSINNEGQRREETKPLAIAGKKLRATDRPIKEDPVVFEKAPVNNNETVSSSIYVDAKTDTVRIQLVPSEVTNAKRFEGLYLIDGKEYSEKEIRELAASGHFEIYLSARPRVAYYPPKSEEAIQRWGDKAEKGIILIEPPTHIIP